MDDETRENRAEDRRGRGPLGDEGDTGETTRRVRRSGERGRDGASTSRIPPEEAEQGAATRASERTSRGATPAGDEDPETRVIRASGDEVAPYPSGYMEASEMREARLREIYGGVDWLASFVGCVFALVCGAVLLSVASLLLNLFLGASTLNLQSFDTVAITSLVVIGVVLLVAFFCGGYVAGRLVRFDGGRNGAMTVGWGLLLSVIFAIFGVFLGGPLLAPLQEFAQAGVGPAIGGLTQAGLIGLGIAVGALLLELLGGFLGGRAGHSYHTRIDETN